jgi:hypothetical protein
VNRFVSDPLDDPAVDAMLDELRAGHVNGGALFARFRITGQPMTSPDGWIETGLLDSFLLAESLRDALPELGVGEQLRSQPRWTRKNATALAEDLAQTLVVGGAYERFHGSPREAIAIAARFCAALVDQRSDGVHVYFTGTPWSPWFFDVAWDYTWIVVDGGTSTVALLCVTDTD